MKTTKNATNVLFCQIQSMTLDWPHIKRGNTVVELRVTVCGRGWCSVGSGLY